MHQFKQVLFFLTIEKKKSTGLSWVWSPDYHVGNNIYFFLIRFSNNEKVKIGREELSIYKEII